jgi:DNA processing protein
LLHPCLLDKPPQIQYPRIQSERPFAILLQPVIAVTHKGYWIAFNKVPGIGPARLAALLEVCGTPEAAWKASIQQLQAAHLDRRTLESLLLARRQLDPEKEWQRAQQAGVQVLTWADANYPESLRQVDGAPPVLYVSGTLLPDDNLAIAIVGTRRASAYGREVAHRLGAELARNRVTVVSGLALGIDAVAHKAALDSGGRTIAVLGSGVDQVYPLQHRQLAQAIATNGAVVSEYPLGTRPEASNFPPRNRIISGLSRAVVIVEAGVRSGALITANFAADQGREVFAVPGNILSAGSAGCNDLIRQGATPLLAADDLLEFLSLTTWNAQQSARQLVPPDPLEERLLDHLSGEPAHIDELVRLSALSTPQVSSLLTLMELKGMVRQSTPLSYVRSQSY